MIRKRHIQHKRSSVAGNVPTAGQLEPGELAINFPDRSIYTLSDTSEIVRLTGHVPIGLPIDTPVDGDGYIDPVTGKLYIFYTLTGAGGSTWNEIAPPENLLQYLPFIGGGMQGPLDVVVPADGNELISYDQASDTIASTLSGHVRIDGTTPMEGLLTLFAAPVNPTDAATKKYVDDAAAAAAPDLSGYMPRSGGTMTGPLTLKGGSTGNQAVTFNEQLGVFVSHEAATSPHVQLALDTDLATHKSKGGDQHPGATPSVHGFMSKTDKARFDLIEHATPAEVDAEANLVKYVTTQDLWYRVNVSIPARTREKLFANRTYYVRDNGNDSNDGLADTSARAFLTWQYAVLVAASYDFNGFAVTIRCTQNDVVFTAGAIIPKMIGVTQPGNFILRGNTTDPNEVKITTNDLYGFRVNGGMCRVEGFQFQIAAAVLGDAAALSATNGGILEQRNNIFAAQVAQPGYLCTHILAERRGGVYLIGDYEVIGSSLNHLIAHTRGYIHSVADVGIVGDDVDFSQYALAMRQGLIHVPNNVSYGDDAAGARYLVTSKAVIASADTLPGTTSGSTSTGGVYVSL